jgi:hypothetical protein
MLLQPRNQVLQHHESELQGKTPPRRKAKDCNAETVDVVITLLTFTPETSMSPGTASSELQKLKLLWRINFKYLLIWTSTLIHISVVFVRSYIVMRNLVSATNVISIDFISIWGEQFHQSFSLLLSVIFLLALSLALHQSLLMLL